MLDHDDIDLEDLLASGQPPDIEEEFEFDDVEPPPLDDEDFDVPPIPEDASAVDALAMFDDLAPPVPVEEPPAEPVSMTANVPVAEPAVVVSPGRVRVATELPPVPVAGVEPPVNPPDAGPGLAAVERKLDLLTDLVSGLIEVAASNSKDIAQLKGALEVMHGMLGDVADGVLNASEVVLAHIDNAREQSGAEFEDLLNRVDRSLEMADGVNRTINHISKVTSNVSDGFKAYIDGLVEKRSEQAASGTASTDQPSTTDTSDKWAQFRA